jgi:hypothetical protein
MSSDNLTGSSRKKHFYIVYFLVCLGLLTFLFFRLYRGIQGDGIFYYSFTASILWDGDFDLRNQYDHPAPSMPGKTVTNGNYFVDINTEKAFSLFNPGTGLLMIPSVGLGKLIDEIRGGKHQDSFSRYYQYFAGYSSIILTALALLLLFFILQRFFALQIAALIPVLFLLGTNWLFYSVVFSAWSHAPAVFLCTLLLWSFLLLTEKGSLLAAGLFGLCGGVFFCTRNFSILLFVLFCLFFLFSAVRKTGKVIPKQFIPHFAVIFIFFFLGAFPHFLVNSIQHGSPFTTSLQAVTEAEKPFGFLEGSNFQALDWRNCYTLYTNLFNSTNGLFYFHPIYLVGLVGAVLFIYRGSLYQSLISLMLAGVYVFWFIDSAYFDNWFSRAAGAGFGHRRFLDLLPLFIFGASNLAAFLGRKKAGKFLISFFYSVLLTCGILLFHLFIHDFPHFYRVHDSFFKLYGHLLGNSIAWFLIIVFFLIIFFILREKRQKKNVFWRSPIVILGMTALFVLPVFFLKSDSEWIRERFKNKKGFFLMYSLNSYVRLPSKYWGFPEKQARPLLTSSAEICLPAPLKKGDLLLFKITPLEPAEKKGTTGENQVTLTLYADGQPLGNKSLGPGIQICRFEAGERAADSRMLTVKFDGAGDRSPLALFHEGRVIFREACEPPFGHVDIPPDKPAILDSQSMVFAGWALDDRGVEDVLIKREILPEEVNPDADENGLITLGRAEFEVATRPDVENIFVLYPSLFRAGWRFQLERSLLPRCQDTAYKIHIFARDSQGHEAEIGVKEVICRR